MTRWASKEEGAKVTGRMLAMHSGVRHNRQGGRGMTMVMRLLLLLVVGVGVSVLSLVEWLMVYMMLMVVRMALR